MYELPTEIIVEERQYRLRQDGDYRVILDAFSALEDDELTQEERIISALIIFYEDFNDVEDVIRCNRLEELVKSMYWFFRGGEDENSGKIKNQKLVDWDNDSAIIVSAINNVAGKEIRAEKYLHWWTFLAYYTAISESVLSTVISIRNKLMCGKKLEKWEQEYRTNNPHYFNWRHKTADDIDAENWLKSVWNKE